MAPTDPAKQTFLSYSSLRLCINPSGSPAYPFTPWWGFGNVVWPGNESLLICLDINFGIEEYAVRYRMEVSGQSGNCEFLKEELDIPGYLHIGRSLQNAEYKLDQNFLKKVELQYRPSPYTTLRNLCLACQVLFQSNFILVLNLF